MKNNIFKLLLFSLAIFFIACSEDNLETVPTDRVSRDDLFKTTQGAQTAMNGVYRMLYTSSEDWTPSNTHQNFGIMSTKLYTSLMGEDMVQDAQGNGWFYFDYRFDVRSRYTSASWRPYATWNYYYQIVSNVNYVIAAEETMVGDPEAIENILAQAYTMRAYAYFILIQSFQQTYIGHESAPGVPLYTEPTTFETEGKGRGTVEEVYTLINADLDAAIEKFGANKNSQEHISHADYYIANAIKANVALVQNKWADAVTYSEEALSKPNLAMLSSSTDLHSGFNSVKLKDVMWGGEIIADQSGIYASFFAHMDASAERYARSSRKCIYNWLYNHIPSTDVRKAWWNGSKDGGTNVTKPYNQVKFRYSNKDSDLGDYIFMRAEEMQLVLAEALARNNQLTEAREVLVQLMKLRDPSYLTSLENITLSNQHTMGSMGNPTTLLDMILLQRRIELWGESERIFDILRLKTGFDRNASGSNHSQKLATLNTLLPDNKEFILTIPQKEFDGNSNMDATTDQNPM